MKILVINAGSSSLKYQLIDMDGEKLIAKGVCERIGIDGKISGNTFDGREFKYSVELKTTLRLSSRSRRFSLRPTRSSTTSPRFPLSVTA